MHSYQVAASRPSSSHATSPSSTDSPSVLTPATPSAINKPLAPMPGTLNAPAISINKTWVLPPKPKPGRKPAIDTPPTKRKAQNREAQRAFRERRAAKVGELEEDMKKMEEEDVREQEALRARIQQLENNVQDYEAMVKTWSERFNEMQMACGRERQMREQAEREVENLREVVGGGTGVVALPLRRDRKDRYVAEQINGVPQMNEIEGDSEESEQVSMTCGKCSNDTRCQCIEEAFDIGNIIDDAAAPPFKRPHSPPSKIDSKRLRINLDDSDDNDDTEIDFTSQFATRRPPILSTSTSTASSSIPAVAPPDQCGFCSNDTPCICAEMAKERSRNHQDTKSSQYKPPPSKSQSANGISVSNPCAKGPGTCAQCLSNPMSTLFCKSVAANRSSTIDSPSSKNAASGSAAPSSGPNLTCAEAFTTLSRHPAFSAATDEFDTWIPQLTAIPKTSNVPERTAFDIEAASVMGVLKLFDRRFGSQG